MKLKRRVFKTQRDAKIGQMIHPRSKNGIIYSSVYF